MNIETLWKCRRWDGEKYIYSGACVDIVLEIETLGREQGLTLSRWQTNRHRGCTINYALHRESEPRARRSAEQEGVVFSCTFENQEGVTQNCEAYKALREMYDNLHCLSAWRAIQGRKVGEQT